MRLAVLGSGSGGNATLLDSGQGCLLVDAGLSAKQLVLRMRELGVEPGDLTGILVTHEHGDHVKGLEVFSRKFEVPVYATALTQEVLARKVTSVKQWKLFTAGQSFECGGISVESVAIPHDAVDPVGFLFEHQGMRAGVVTDLGHASSRLIDRLRGISAMVLEANYCDQMLEDDEVRPWSLKQRISSRHGHLSNHQARDLARELQSSGLERVVLGHLSKDCNHAQVASKVFEELGLREVRVASQTEVTGWMPVADPAPVALSVDEATGQVVMELFG
ncbi:MBL fold metallo-hydrolase [Roseibacillus persicicus]|uniref:MBL fold metallo-hydrolase n=1 Tax=Roseibacillus persicicus TaxID=454148 RepID=UPI00280F4A65|nr:MBL fold metallo-hydrolase [Roseibacillus persicicus]MDQ8189592.1 MBL fold metallo-hydrolase [Roseibacillus persicicus]